MNSSIEIAEAVKLAQKLIDRTREGKRPWEADIVPRNLLSTTDVTVATSFTTKLEGNLKATVSTVKQGHDERLAFSLVEAYPGFFEAALTTHPDASQTVTEDKNVLSVSVEKNPSYGYDTQEESDLSKLLLDLYELARRSALKIDGSVEKALSYLDRIAV
jgi:hypothetical protein